MVVLSRSLRWLSSYSSRNLVSCFFWVFRVFVSFWLLAGDKNDNEENARMGVFWLMQASEQGCQEATEMLQTCLDSEEGITEHNYLDVKSCLNTPLNEKLARRAAREMFLSLSCGQDFITTEQLRRRMRSIERGENSQRETSEDGWVWIFFCGYLF